jgi:stringent starvation protein B
MTISKKPYLLRAFYDWMTDARMTPYLLVDANMDGVEVPQSFVSENGEIVLDVSATAIRDFTLTRKSISFEASFPGKACHLTIPLHAVMALYSNETEEGIYFDEEGHDNAGLVMEEYEIEDDGGDIPLSAGFTDHEVRQVTPKKPVLTIVGEDEDD